MQPNAVVEQVSKAVPAHIAEILLGGTLAEAGASARSDARGSQSLAPRLDMPFTTMAEIQRAVARHLHGEKFEKNLFEIVQLSYRKARGEV
jgi:hypothetical protein